MQGTVMQDVCDDVYEAVKAASRFIQNGLCNQSSRRLQKFTSAHLQCHSCTRHKPRGTWLAQSNLQGTCMRRCLHHL